MENINVIVGRKIKEIRKSKRLTQEELAFKSNISLPFISQIETGVKRASLETFYKLARALDVELGVFFSDAQFKQREIKPFSFKGLTRKQKRYLDHFLKTL